MDRQAKAHNGRVTRTNERGNVTTRHPVAGHFRSAGGVRSIRAYVQIWEMFKWKSNVHKQYLN